MGSHTKVIRIHTHLLEDLFCLIVYFFQLNVQIAFSVFVLTLARGCAEIWPPHGHLTPNNYIPPPICTYEQEKVYEDILEEVCTTENVKNCSVQLVTEREPVTETVCDEACDTEAGTACDLDPDTCDRCDDDDNDQNCHEAFRSETKTECSYETKMDKKCFRQRNIILHGQL